MPYIPFLADLQYASISFDASYIISKKATVGNSPTVASFYFLLFKAAFTKSLNNGCGCVGRDLNSG